MKLTLRELLEHTATYLFILLVWIAVAIYRSDASFEAAVLTGAPIVFFVFDLAAYGKYPIRAIASAILTYFSLPLGYTTIFLNTAYFLLSFLHEIDINTQKPS